MSEFMPEGYEEPRSKTAGSYFKVNDPSKGEEQNGFAAWVVLTTLLQQLWAGKFGLKYRMRSQVS